MLTTRNRDEEFRKKGINNFFINQDKLFNNSLQKDAGFKKVHRNSELNNFVSKNKDNNILEELRIEDEINSI